MDTILTTASVPPDSTAPTLEDCQRYTCRIVRENTLKLRKYLHEQASAGRNKTRMAARTIAALAATRMRLDQDSRIRSVIASAPTLWETPVSQSGGSLLDHAREAIEENLVNTASDEISACRMEFEMEPPPLTWEQCTCHLRECADHYGEKERDAFRAYPDAGRRAAVQVAAHTIVTLNVRDPIRLQGLFDSDPTLWDDKADLGARPLTALTGHVCLADWMAQAVNTRLMQIALHALTGDEQYSEVEATASESAPAP